MCALLQLDHVPEVGGGYADFARGSLPKLRRVEGVQEGKPEPARDDLLG
jgi:hypothetical protein